MLSVFSWGGASSPLPDGLIFEGVSEQPLQVSILSCCLFSAWVGHHLLYQMVSSLKELVTIQSRLVHCHVVCFQLGLYQMVSSLRESLNSQSRLVHCHVVCFQLGLYQLVSSLRESLNSQSRLVHCHVVCFQLGLYQMVSSLRESASPG